LPKISPLDGRFRPESERWSPTFRVEMAVVRASDFLSDKLLGDAAPTLRFCPQHL
jgi:hypothetical protein